jgi:hypothetical protein
LNVRNLTDATWWQMERMEESFPKMEWEDEKKAKPFGLASL